jgi:hypothetical protein
VDGFIEALVDGDVLAGVGILDQLDADGRDLVAFSEQLVLGLRSRLVAALTSPRDAVVGTAALTEAARRLTGIDASRSGLGGYRWQLELALLAAAGPVDGQSRGGPTHADPAPSTRSLATRVARPGPGSRQVPPTDTPSSDGPRTDVPPTEDLPPAAASAASLLSPAPESRTTVERADDVADDTPATAAGDADIVAIRSAWPQIVAAIARNPANRPLVASSRPVEVRDGFIVLGFPEDQAFLRDIAERKRSVIEAGIASVVGRPVAVRCVVTNLELVAPVVGSEGDLVAQATRIFEGELAAIEDID